MGLPGEQLARSLAISMPRIILKLAATTFSSELRSATAIASNWTTVGFQRRTLAGGGL